MLLTFDLAVLDDLFSARALRDGGPTVLPIDPDADRSRRAWLPCPNCDHGSACGDCSGGRNCANHWQYLLNNCGRRVHLQCPGCTHLWSVDTRAA